MLQQSDRYTSFYKAFLLWKISDKQKIGYNELPGTHHPGLTVINSGSILSHFPLGCPCLGLQGQSWFKLVLV